VGAGTLVDVDVLAVVCVLLLVIGGLLAWREPRRLLPAVFLASGMAVLVADVSLDLISGTSTLTAAWFLLGAGMVALLAVAALGLALIVNGVRLIGREGFGVTMSLSAALGTVLVGYAVSVVVGVIAGWSDSSSSNTILLILLALALPAGYLGFVFAIVVGWSYLYVRWGAIRARRESVDAIVVLGAGLKNGTTVGPLLGARLDRALEVARRSRELGADPVIVSSGGRGSDEARSEASAMTEYLAERGMPADRLLSEDRSTDTAENLRFSAQMLVGNDIRGTAAVVTNDYHVFRAATMMREAGIRGFGTGAPTAPYFMPNAEIREYVAILRDHRWVTAGALVLLSIPLVLVLVGLIA
jgi:uncharacterized SAM-binding protein YcdF (DUF218 family)